jgi:Protein of unknown function (DUF3040)
MSLPVAQRRLLEDMEDALKASEPHLASMFAIFACLHAGEPIRAERLPGWQGRWPPGPAGRPRWSPPGTAIYAVLLVPLMFLLVLLGALLSSGGHSERTCELGYAAGASSPLANQPGCETAARTTSATSASGAGGRTCTGTTPAARAAAWNSSELPFSALAIALRTGTAKAPPPLCYK